MRALKLAAFAVIVTSGLVAALAAAVQVTLAQGTTDKITICHAAGLEGTTMFVTLNLPPAAVYGPAGHFLENGTTAAGHEQDYFGACNETGTTGTTGTVPDDDPPPTTGTTGTTGTTTTVCVGCGPGQQTAPTETQPPGPRCPPGFEPGAGKDGEPGNDECRRPESPPATTSQNPVTETPPVTTTGGVAPTDTTSTEPEPQPDPAPVPKPKPKPINPSGEDVPPSVCKARGGAPYFGTCYPKRHGGPVLPGEQG